MNSTLKQQLMRRPRQPGHGSNRNTPPFRIIHLQPGTGDEAIECSIETVSFVSAPQYEALSYTWSRRESQYTPVTDEILVNGVPTKVLPNLGAALKTLRYPSSIRVLWVDYLCIDQSNILERNEQIQRMGSVFSEASRVICYLGEADTTVPSAVECLEILSEHEQVDSVVCVQLDPHTRTRLTLALAELLERPWFGRVWTIQEVALAKAVTLVCGHHEIPWKSVETAADHLFRRGQSCWGTFIQSSSEIYRACLGLQNAMARARAGRNQTDYLSFSALVLDFSHHTATDPRDHVYGLLGLLSQRRFLMTSNYRLPKEAVFTRAARAAMRAEKRLDYLSALAPHIQRSEGKREGPSWVIDFSQLQPRWAPFVPDLNFQACGVHTETDYLRVKDYMIMFSGVVVDTVNASMDETPRASLEQDVYAIYSPAHASSLLTHLQAIEQILEAHQDSLTYIERHVRDGQHYKDGDTPVDSLTVPKRSDIGIWKHSPSSYTLDPATPSPLSEDGIHKGSDFDPPPHMKALYRTLTFGTIAKTSVEAEMSALSLHNSLKIDGKNVRYRSERLISDTLAFQMGSTARRALENHVRMAPDSDWNYLQQNFGITNSKVYFSTLVAALGEVKFFLTKGGRMGVCIGPDDVQEGDSVVVLKGGQVPFLLRPVKDGSLVEGGKLLGDTFTFVGIAYVDGIMDGEATQDVVEVGSHSDLKSDNEPRTEKHEKTDRTEGDTEKLKRWQPIYLV